MMVLAMIYLMNYPFSGALLAQNHAGLKKIWTELAIENEYHVGLSIYDLSKEKWIFNHREDNYFTPASNVKLLTMLATLTYLDEKIPAAFYQEKEDTLFIWGGGDPGTLYPPVRDSAGLVDFIRNTNKQIVFSEKHFEAERFGSGWAWDDFKYNYQAERTAYPVYGNRLWVERRDDTVSITPEYFQPVFNIQKDTTDKLSRNEWGTKYLYQYTYGKKSDKLSIPVSLFKSDIRGIWKEITGKDISWVDVPIPNSTQKINGTPRDTLLKIMMQQSDNFIAEQLLLSCALKMTGKMLEEEFIERMLKGPLADIPDKISWVDGSGLSRYNLMTPRSTLFVLDKLIRLKGLDYMKSILPAGGQSGTIIDWYESPNGTPYLYAKTGTLSNASALTGILITKSDRVILFSWMHNQFTKNTAVIKSNMQKLFTWIRDNY
ncbi:MAG: D-alanyl-D-alanine carboxypeptidase [Saprospiraceae bacterium]